MCLQCGYHANYMNGVGYGNCSQCHRSGMVRDRRDSDALLQNALATLTSRSLDFVLQDIDAKRAIRMPASSAISKLTMRPKRTRHIDALLRVAKMSTNCWAA